MAHERNNAHELGKLLYHVTEHPLGRRRKMAWRKMTRLCEFGRIQPGALFDNDFLSTGTTNMNSKWPAPVVKYDVTDGIRLSVLSDACAEKKN